MNYIRTKDGRIVDVSFPSRIRTKVLKTHDTKWILEHNADTIEELCDEFAEVGNGKPFLSEVRFEHWDKQTKNILIKQGTKVYGAIWTDEGLIYVAKMNKKGELELL